MAVVSDPTRVEIWRDWMQQNPNPVTINKTQLRSAVNAIDQWVSDNAASLVAALPAATRPANGGLTASQIAYLMQLVLEYRYRDGV